MGIMVHSLSWVMPDLYHQPYLYIKLCKVAIFEMYVKILNPIIPKHVRRP